MWRVVTALALLAIPAWPYPEGPPESACTEMRPGTAVGTNGLEGHVTLAVNYQAGKSKVGPYYIQIHDYVDHYLPDTDYQVSIVANQTFSENHYVGLLLQARQVECAGNTTIRVKDMPLGTFTVPTVSTTAPLLTTMTCSNIERSAVGHFSRQYKINETVTWRSPSDITGPVVFRMTIVQSATVYWTEQNSLVMLDSSGQKPESCSASHIPLSISLYSSAVLLAIFRFTH